MKQSANLTEHRFRAKYIPMPDGSLALYQIQEFSRPVFVDSGWECDRIASTRKKGEQSDNSVRQAVRRAQRMAFDLVLSNHDLDAFVTLTFAPKEEMRREVFNDVYKPLKTFLSNRVQRRGLKYVLVGERHKKGGIHFHALCNSSALHLVEAINPKNGKPLIQNGQQVFNVEDWGSVGFSTCKILGCTLDDRVRVAKYVTKYITKDSEKIGGRYVYHGGKLNRPILINGDSLEDFNPGQPVHVYRTHIEGVGDYAEHTYI